MSHFLYVTACDEQGGIYRYSLSNEGKLSLCDITPCDSPMFLHRHENYMTVLLRSPYPDSQNGAFCTYRIAPDGSLCDPSALRSTDGIVPCHLTKWQGMLCAVNYVSGSVKIGDTLCVHTGSGPNLPRQDTAHTHFCAPTPDGKYLCVCDLGLDSIYLYRPDATVHSITKVPNEHGARHLVFSEDGRYAYCVNELISSISVFAYEDGNLTLLQTVSALPDGWEGKNTAAAIKRRGNTLYVSNRGHDSVARFEMIEGGAAVRLCEIMPCGGAFPRDVTVAGDYLVCSNQNSNTVTVLSLDGDAVGGVCDKVSAPSPICAIWEKV